MFTHQLRRTLDAVIHDEIDTVRWYLQQTKYMIIYVLSLFISTSGGVQWIVENSDLRIMLLYQTDRISVTHNEALVLVDSWVNHRVF